MSNLNPQIELMSFHDVEEGGLIRYGDDGIGIKMSIPLGEGSISGAPRMPYVLELRGYKLVSSDAIDPYVLRIKEKFVLEINYNGFITKDKANAVKGDIALAFGGFVGIVTEGARAAFSLEGQKLLLDQGSIYYCKDWIFASTDTSSLGDKRCLFTRMKPQIA